MNKFPAQVAADPTSRLPRPGDTCCTFDMREDLYMRLKAEAVKRRTTVDEIIEGLVQQYITPAGKLVDQPITPAARSGTGLSHE